MTYNLKLKYSDELIITNEISSNEILTIKSTITNDMGNGYVWYTLPETRINGFYLRLSICFKKGVIDSINFKASKNKFKDWKNWSESQEKKICKSTLSWLKSNSLETGDYSWGRIYVGYDSKSASGVGIINFV